MCEQFFLPPMTVYWNWDDAIGFTKLWTSFTWRIHIVTSNFNIFPSRIQILVSDLVYLFFLPVWDDEHGPLTFLFFRGGCLEHQPRGSTSGYCFQKFLGPDAPAPWISLSFLAIKNGARLYGKESSHDLLLMLIITLFELWTAFLFFLE